MSTPNEDIMYLEGVVHGLTLQNNKLRATNAELLASVKRIRHIATYTGTVPRPTRLVCIVKECETAIAEEEGET